MGKHNLDLPVVVVFVIAAVLLTACSSGSEQQAAPGEAQQAKASSVDVNQFLSELNTKLASLDAYTANYLVDLSAGKGAEFELPMSLEVKDVKDNNGKITIIKQAEANSYDMRIGRGGNEVLCTKQELITCRPINSPEEFSLKLDTVAEQNLASGGILKFAGESKVNDRPCYNFNYVISKALYGDYMGKLFSYLQLFITNKSDLESDVSMCVDKEYGFIGRFTVRTRDLAGAEVQTLEIKSVSFSPKMDKSLTLPAAFSLTKMSCYTDKVDFAVLGLKEGMTSFTAKFNNEEIGQFSHDFKFGDETTYSFRLASLLPENAGKYYWGSVCSDGVCSESVCQIKSEG